MDLPFLSVEWSIGQLIYRSFNPYSNGSSFFIILSENIKMSIHVSILILMDLPFLLLKERSETIVKICFNPYSNGSSFFILFEKLKPVAWSSSFNPYSNGSSFFIIINC